ncbi:MAG: hypothetical protein AB7R69_00445 [Candidatus Babeliales bacterium]
MIKKTIFSTLVFITMNAMDNNSCFMQSYNKTLAAINAYQKVEPNQINFLYAMKNEPLRKGAQQDLLSCAELKNARAQGFTIDSYRSRIFTNQCIPFITGLFIIGNAGIVSNKIIQDIQKNRKELTAAWDSDTGRRYEYTSQYTAFIDWENDRLIKITFDKVLLGGLLVFTALLTKKFSINPFLMNKKKCTDALLHVTSKKEAAKHNETLMRNIVDREKL